MKILIVDDKEEERYLAETLLKGSGYEVASATNGAEALAKLRTEWFDMIVSDVLMPVMDGFRLCRECKGDEKLKDIPFVFYTATYKDERDEDLASKVGADKYIRKPIEPEEFVKVIQGLVRDIEEGKIGPKKLVLEEEREVLKLYSERLIEKLEKKMLDLEIEISERKQAQEELQIAEANFRNSLDNSPLGIRIVTAEGELIYTNQSMLDIYGYSSVEGLKATPTKERYTSESYTEHHERVQIRKRGKPVPSNYEVSIVRKDGEIRHLIASRKAVVWSGEVQYQTIYQDITDRKQAEHDLNERMKELRCLYDISNIAERPGISPDVLYREAANQIPSGWQYLEITCCRITINEKEYRTDNYKETEWKQSADIRMGNETIGKLEVNYLEKRPEIDEGPFQKEERHLINSLAERLGLVTERMQAKEALRESEEKLRNIIDNTYDVIFQISPLGIIQYVSPKVKEIYGYEPEDLIGKHLKKTTPVSQLPKAFKALKSILSGRIINNLEIKQLDANGKIIYMEISGAPVKKDGKIVAAQGIMRDITERRQAEEDIRRAAEEWRATFDSITDLVSIHDKDFRLVRVNKAFAEAVNIKPEELVGKTCYQVVHGTSEPVPSCPHMKMLETKAPAIKDFLEPHLGIHLEIATSPVFSDTGDVVASIHVARDITERKQMEGKLIATDRLASIGELASGIAHELNNPLTSVIGFSELLLDKDVSGDVKEDLKVVNREAKRTAGIVRNLLTFARKHPEEKQSVDVNKIIQMVLELRAYEQKVNNIGVNTRFTPDLPEVLANGFELQQVFINIIINAEHFMIESHGRGTLTITTKRMGNIIRTSFADDGPGIAKENLGHLFDPFFTTKEVGKGTGLGLSICHGIATSHGGSIYAESELGKGATFVVELPIPTTDNGVKNK